MLETTASINTDFFKELIRIKKQKIAVNNAVTDVLLYVLLSLSKRK